MNAKVSEIKMRKTSVSIREYKLGADAVKFVWEQMAKGGPLCTLLRLSPQGVVWAYLPSGAEQFQGSKNLEEGGVFDSESAGDILREVISFIRAYLQENPLHVVLCEDRFFSMKDPPNAQAQDIFEWRGTAYHYRTHLFAQASDQEFEQMVNSASSYPAIILLTQIESAELLPKRAEIESAVAHKLAENILHIVVGSYDEEGYLIWDNRSNRILG